MRAGRIDRRVWAYAGLAVAQACTTPPPSATTIVVPVKAATSALGPQPAFLLKDIYTGTTNVSSYPHGMVAVGSTVYFAATTTAAGMELWKTDGTTGGTVAVKDISPLTVNSSNPTCLTVFAGALYFYAADTAGSNGFFRSDGTPEGTVLLKRVRLLSSCPAIALGAMFFAGTQTPTGQELWRSDGTADGTMLVKDINPGASGSSPDGFLELAGVLYFTANDGSTGTELWRSDGTADGTAMVADIAPGSASSSPQRLTALGEVILFSATDVVAGTELWSSDGTATGTRLVKDVAPGAVGSNPWRLGIVGGRFIFGANDGTAGAELWKSDGTEAGTVLVKDIFPGAGSSSPAVLAPSGGSLYFSATDGVTGKELWKTDGTSSGTVLVKDIFPGAGGSSPAQAVDLGGVLVFSAGGMPAGNTELWRSDGTAAGTVLVKDILPGASPSLPTNLVAVGSVAFFSADNGVVGTELWKTDGTTAGTVLLKDLEPGARSGGPEYLVDFGGSLFFRAADATKGIELWKSDGTAAGTVLVKDVLAGAFSSSPTGLTVFNDRLLFFAYTIVGSDVGLWSTDGTTVGTTLVKVVAPAAIMAPSCLTSFGDFALFNASDGVVGTELWRTDGTAAGTYMIKDINPGAPGSSPCSFVHVGGVVLFVAYDAVNDVAIWRTDGTTAGTEMVADIRPCAGLGGYYVNPAPWVFGNILYFTADDCSHGWELWRTDGTATGTSLFTDIYPGPSSSYAGGLTSIVGGRFIFSATDADHGSELWSTDLTAVGTSLLSDISPGPGGTVWPQSFTSIGDAILFNARHTQELWRTDGTAAGTVSMKEIGAGSDTLPLSEFTALPAEFAQAAFVAYEPASGSELWASDGTASGTRLVADILPGPLSSNPSKLKVSGNFLYFVASTPDVGAELWAVPLSAFDLTPPVITATVTGTLGANDWHVSDVGVTFSVSDAQSPVSSSSGCNAVSITTDTTGTTYTCSATSVGGTASVSVTVKRDTMPPSVLCPGDLVVEATSGAGAAVNYDAAPAADSFTASPAVAYSQNSGTTFPLGTVTVDATATDDAGHSAACSFTITVVDTTAPTVTCGTDVVAEATGAAGALVTYNAASAIDAVTSSPSIVYSKATGSLFALGTTSVSASATDGADNIGACVTTVTVRDTTAPVPSCPASIVQEATSAGGTSVAYAPASAIDSVDGAPGLSYSHASGSAFALGATGVTVTATDFSGNDGTCAFTIEVRDTTAPSLTCPSAVTAEATSPSGAIVAFSSATAGDAVTVAPHLSYSIESGAAFALGTTAVTVTAADAVGNSASCTFDVSVIDSTAPALSCPGSVTASAVGPAGVAVAYSTATASDAADAAPQISYSVTSGAVFSLGTTSVSVTATDAAGNSDTCAFDVVVEDTDGPTIVCPTDIMHEATGPNGAIVSYAAITATDAVDGTLAATYSHASGSTFALGTTVVTASATDAAGNSSTCTFNLTISDTTAPSVVCPGDVTANASGPSGALATYGLATTSDLVDAAPTLVYSQASGTLFVLGTTAVTVIATDASGLSTSCGFDMTVQDNDSPSIACPPDVAAEATSASGAIVAFQPAAASDMVTGSPIVTYSHDSDAQFALGETRVTATATDDAGHSTSCIFGVTVADHTAPSLTCPGAVAASSKEAKGVLVTYASATTTDAVDVAPTVSYSPGSGAVFLLGVTVVTVNATDAAGNQASCTFAVTVSDTSGPSVTCPSNVVVEATGRDGAITTYEPAAATGGGGGTPELGYSHASGTVFALGVTTISATARDALGQTASCTFAVRVVDTTPPSVICPTAMVASARDASGAVVTYLPAVAADLSDGAPVLTYSSAAGASFAIGNTTVTATATDTSGNAASCSFTVTVTQDVPPGASCPTIDADGDGKSDPCPASIGGSAVGVGCGCNGASGSPALLAWLGMAVVGLHGRRRHL